MNIFTCVRRSKSSGEDSVSKSEAANVSLLTLKASLEVLWEQDITILITSVDACSMRLQLIVNF